LIFADVEGTVGAKEHLDGYVVGEVTNDGADYRWCYVQPKLKQGHRKPPDYSCAELRPEGEQVTQVRSTDLQATDYQNYRTASEVKKSRRHYLIILGVNAVIMTLQIFQEWYQVSSGINDTQNFDYLIIITIKNEITTKSFDQPFANINNFFVLTLVSLPHPRHPS
jgi:hypothetical protein